jgi:hypothetical protein
MTRAFVFLAVVVLGTALAQSGAKLEAFTPAPLPETQMPNPIPKTMTTIPSNISFGGACLPSLKGLKVPTDVSGAKLNLIVSRKIQAIVDADQAVRKATLSDKEGSNDQKRREALLPLILQAVSSQDFANIALVFQHGDCVPLFMLANRMALMAIKTAAPNAKYASQYVDPKWLYAATLDRALMTSRRAQKYRTQYFGFDGACERLYVVDPRTTDAERKAYGVPTLQEALLNAKKMATPNCK